MSDTSGTRRARAEGTRSRLLDAAVDAFSRNGFHGTTTRDIAAGAGISPGALYVHHRSKEEVLHEISLSGHRATLQVVQDAAATSTDPAEQLSRVIGDFAAHHARCHVQARVINYELSGLTPEHLDQVRALRHEIEEIVVGIVEAGVSADRFRVDDARMTAVALLSMGLDVSRWYREEGSWTPERIGEFYAGLALRIVAATGSWAGS